MAALGLDHPDGSLRRGQPTVSHHDAGTLTRQQQRGGAAVSDGLAGCLAAADEDGDLASDSARHQLAANSAWTRAATAFMSARPRSRGESRPISLPWSRGPCAPLSLIAFWMASSTAAASSCCGK